MRTLGKVGKENIIEFKTNVKYTLYHKSKQGESTHIGKENLHNLTEARAECFKMQLNLHVQIIEK